MDNGDLRLGSPPLFTQKGLDEDEKIKQEIRLNRKTGTDF